MWVWAESLHAIHVFDYGFISRSSAPIKYADVLSNEAVPRRKEEKRSPLYILAVTPRLRNICECACQSLVWPPVIVHANLPRMVPAVGRLRTSGPSWRRWCESVHRRMHKKFLERTRLCGWQLATSWRAARRRRREISMICLKFKPTLSFARLLPCI